MGSNDFRKIEDIEEVIWNFLEKFRKNSEN